jgi:hypothetical protein
MQEVFHRISFRSGDQEQIAISLEKALVLNPKSYVLAERLRRLNRQAARVGE